MKKDNLFKAQRFSIRKLAIGVTSLAVGVAIIGTPLASVSVHADEMSNSQTTGFSVQYQYVAESELTAQEKELIVTSLPENTTNQDQSYYLVYRPVPQASTSTVLPKTNSLSSVAGVAVGGSLLVLGISVLKRGKAKKQVITSLMLLSSLAGASYATAVHAIEAGSLSRYNQVLQLKVGDSLPQGVEIPNYVYVGYIPVSTGQAQKEEDTVPSTSDKVDNTTDSAVSVPSVPSNPSQPVQPVEPSQPVEVPNKDTGSTVPVVPEVPTIPVTPTEPTQPSTPVEQPIQPVEQPTTPTEPSNPVEPTEPAQPEQPSEPTQPSMPVEQPTQPVEQPTTPTEPSNPVEPTEPAQPEQPSEPTEPATPVEQPTQPVEQPTTPTDPSNPVEPVVEKEVVSNEFGLTRKDIDASNANRELVNALRKENGVKPLSVNGALDAMAKARAKELEQLFDHTRPNGERPATIGVDMGFSTKPWLLGENIAFLYADNEELAIKQAFDNWYNSAGHKKNMLNKDYSQFGFGLYNVTDTNVYYAVQLFQLRSY